MATDAPRAALVRACSGRDVSAAGNREYNRLMHERTFAEIADVIEHVHFCKPRRDEDVRGDPETNAAFDALLAQSQERVAAHRLLIERMADKFGVEVGCHRMTRDDALGRLDDLAARLDPMVNVPLRLVHRDVAAETIRDAFAAGVAEARRRHAD
jgi:hypothetical protein